MEVVAKDHQEGRQTETVVSYPMFVPRTVGGWVSYFSYDTVRCVENKKLPFSAAPFDDRNLPDLLLEKCCSVQKAYVIHWVRVDRYSTIEDPYRDGKRQLDICCPGCRILTRLVFCNSCSGTVSKGVCKKQTN